MPEESQRKESDAVAPAVRLAEKQEHTHQDDKKESNGLPDGILQGCIEG